MGNGGGKQGLENLCRPIGGFHPFESSEKQKSRKIDAEIKTKNTAKIFSKVMTSGVINPLFGGVILGGLLGYPDNESKDFEHKIKFSMIGSKILINDKSIF